MHRRILTEIPPSCNIRFILRTHRQRCEPSAAAISCHGNEKNATHPLPTDVQTSTATTFELCH